MFHSYVSVSVCVTVNCCTSLDARFEFQDRLIRNRNSQPRRIHTGVQPNTRKRTIILSEISRESMQHPPLWSMDHRREHARKRANQGGGDAPHAMMGRCAPSVKEASTLRSCFYFFVGASGSARQFPCPIDSVVRRIVKFFFG